MSLMESTDFCIFTVCNLAYLPRAMVLADSVRKYNGKRLKIFLFDEKIEEDFSIFDADITWLVDLNVRNYYQLSFKYDIIEFSTCLKPFITLKLLESHERVIFLDPDTCLFHSVKPILEELEGGSVVLTPHYTTPQSNDLGESDLGMMRFGSFNLGFFAVRRSEQSVKFLEWWSDRCMQLCFMESQFGLSVDQKWVSIAQCFFHDIVVSFNPGYNVAAWNSYERFITRDASGNYMVNGAFPLVFFHFSHFDHEDLDYFNKRSMYEKGVKRPDLYELGLEYSKALVAKTDGFGARKYAYDYMSAGEYISPALRRAYACVLPELPADHDPFDSDGVVGAFARKNHLFQRRNEPYKTSGFGEVQHYSSHFKVVYLLMRLSLRVMGPNKFQNLSRLLVYLSSYRQNRGLWRL
jgi:hypothetical protein